MIRARRHMMMMMMHILTQTHIKTVTDDNKTLNLCVDQWDVDPGVADQVRMLEVD